MYYRSIIIRAQYQIVKMSFPDFYFILLYMFFNDFLEKGRSNIEIDDRIGKALELMRTFVNEQKERNSCLEIELIMDFIFTKVQIVLTEKVQPLPVF